MRLIQISPLCYKNYEIKSNKQNKTIRNQSLQGLENLNLLVQPLCYTKKQRREQQNEKNNTMENIKKKKKKTMNGRTNVKEPLECLGIQDGT